MFSHRMETLRGELAERDIDVALITDDDSVYYFTGYYDYLHMDFGRPTILVVPKDGDSLLVTPSMEMDMAGEGRHRAHPDAGAGQGLRPIARFKRNPG